MKKKNCTNGNPAHPLSLEARPFFNASTTRLAAGDYDGNIRIWDTETGKQVSEFHTDIDPFRVSFSPNGNILGIADPASVLSDSSDRNMVELWNIAGKKRILHIEPDYEASLLDELDIAFLSDELLITHGNQKMDYWDTATGENLMSLGEDELVDSYAFSPDKTLLVTGGLSSFEVRDATSGEIVHSYYFDGGWVTDIVFNHEGTYLATGGSAGIVALWRVIEPVIPDGDD